MFLPMPKVVFQMIPVVFQHVVMLVLDLPPRPAAPYVPWLSADSLLLPPWSIIFIYSFGIHTDLRFSAFSLGLVRHRPNDNQNRFAILVRARD
jgi:hypothetical protein